MTTPPRVSSCSSIRGGTGSPRIESWSKLRLLPRPRPRLLPFWLLFPSAAAAVWVWAKVTCSIAFFLNNHHRFPLPKQTLLQRPGGYRILDCCRDFQPQLFAAQLRAAQKKHPPVALRVDTDFFDLYLIKEGGSGGCSELKKSSFSGLRNMKPQNSPL